MAKRSVTGRLPSIWNSRTTWGLERDFVAFKVYIFIRISWVMSKKSFWKKCSIIKEV